MMEEPKFTAADILAHEKATGVSPRALPRAFARVDPRARAVGYRPAAPGSNLPFELEVRLSKEAPGKEFRGPGEVGGCGCMSREWARSSRWRRAVDVPAGLPVLEPGMMSPCVETTRPRSAPSSTCRTRST